MKLHRFIQDNLDALVAEWEAFARTLLPAAKTTANLALRDHYREILVAIVKDMQAAAARADVTRADVQPAAVETMAAAHGALRHAAGFDLVQLVSEFRAMRSSVFGLWRRAASTRHTTPAIDETERFNEAIDQALTESVARYTSHVTASRDMFLAVLGHDLRSPLQTIEMAGSVIVSPHLANADRLEVGRRITRAAKMMDGLITDILEVTRSRLGVGIPVERAECDLRQTCEEALDVVRGSNPNCEFTHELSGDLSIRADCSRLRQVLFNLLNNAVQHGDRRTPVALRALGDPEAVVVSVVNTGNPIPTEALQLIFEPLVQMPATTTDLRNRPKTSLGLGLFITREIVLGHGGTIDVQSSPDSGTAFTIRLPRTIRTDREARQV
jgi:signal transduction histidine kinase